MCSLFLYMKCSFFTVCCCRCCEWRPTRSVPDGDLRTQYVISWMWSLADQCWSQHVAFFFFFSFPLPPPSAVGCAVKAVYELATFSLLRVVCWMQVTKPIKWLRKPWTGLLLKRDIYMLVDVMVSERGCLEMWFLVDVREFSFYL